MMKTALIAALYGTLAGGTLAPAPKVVSYEGYWRGSSTLTERQANALGYKMVEDVRPAVGSNETAVATGWGETNRIFRIYEVRAIPRTARRIYKYDLSAACIEFGEITNLISLVSADVGTKWMWDAAEILVEDDPYFIAATNEIVATGLISEEKVVRILDRAYELGQNAEAAR